MCGISGFNWNDEQLIKKMNNSLKHRGPDGEGVYVDNLVSLGHRRLAVIDLTEKGIQPMEYEHKNKKVIIVHNGEIYNFQGLRKELESKGYKFKSNTDTEVILASYLEYGYNCVKKFNGMWAFCIYDPQKKILFLSRDRLGQKPLYYYLNREKFIFSSELKGILQHNIKKEINKDAIDLYLSFGFIPSPFSVYKKIFKLEPRQNLIFDIKKNKIKKWYYYKFPKYKPIYNKKKLIKEGRKLLKEATRLRLISDVPIGAFLSGGLDSSTTVAEMANFVDLENLHTFSIGFEGKYDETKFVNIVKNFFKTKHHHKYFKEKDFEKLLNKIFYFYDEPFGDYSMFPTFEVSKLAKKYVTVVLSGDGGDEIFGGYEMHQIAAQMNFLNKIPLFLRKILFNLIPKRENFSKLSQLKEALRISILGLENFYSEIMNSLIYKPEIYKKITREKLKEYLKLAKGNFTEAMILMDRYFYTLGDHFLVKVDRASMAHALEVRSPFLDYRFIEYASKIPAEWKANIFKKKVLMRKIIKGIVPKEIVKRGKQGFTPPLAEWINKEKYLKEINEGLEKLYKKRVIDDNWYNFYKEKVLKRKELIYQNYKIRMFLLWRWWRKWME